MMTKNAGALTSRMKINANFFIDAQIFPASENNLRSMRLCHNLRSESYPCRFPWYPNLQCAHPICCAQYEWQPQTYYPVWLCPANVQSHRPGFVLSRFD